MLNDRERSTLNDIQRQLVTEDPDLASSFRALEPRPPRAPSAPTDEQLHRFYLIWIVIGVACAVLILL
ncbi:MAG: DUF3040 domain-containing protein [Nocardioidaceae bacterium]